MNGGELVGKGTGNGNAVYVNHGGWQPDTSAAFHMTGGTLSDANVEAPNNTIYIISTGNAASTLSGGTVYGNIVTSNTGANANKQKQLELSGDITVTGGVASYGVTTISGGKYLGAVEDMNSTEGWDLTISGGQFAKAPAAAAVAEGMVVADVEDGDYLYKVCADGFYTTGEHMNFGSSLALGLYLNKSTEGYDVAVSGDYTCSVSDDPTNDIHAIFAEGIAAKAMDEKITYTITNKVDEVLFRKTVSIYDAAEKWLADGNTDDDDLVVDMINYGREAQKTFLGEYKMNSLGDTDTVADWNVVDGHGVNAGFENDVAVTLSLKDQIELNVYVNDDEVTVEAGSTEGCVVENVNGITRISFKDIPVVDAHEAVVLNLSNGAEVEFSIADYCALAKGGAQKDLINALMKYIQSVCDYVK